jgi:hypothetical protein
MSVRSHLRHAAVVLGLLASTLVYQPASAGAASSGLLHVFGQVQAVVGPASDPTAFFLQVRNRPIEFRVAARATLTAASAEAEVEGFVSGDYAEVVARRAHHQWIAVKITYDVRSLAPTGSAPVTATVLADSPNGTWVTVQLADGAVRRVLITSNTLFTLDGSPSATPVPLAPGEVVTLSIQPTRRGWVATQIDVRLPQSGVPGS